MIEASDGFEYAWILMCLEDFDNKTPKKKKRPNLAPLLHLLRSDKPISVEVRELLADLFDPKKPASVYAEIKFPRRGRRSTGMRDYDLYKYCEKLKSKNGWKKIPETEWAKIAKKFNITEVSGYATTQFTTTKGAYGRGKKINLKLERIRTEQE